MAALHWVELASGSVPGGDILVTLLEGNVSEGEPEEEARDREEVLGLDKEGVHNEEARQEVHTQEQLSIAEGSESAVAKHLSSLTLPLEDAPFGDAILALATEPVIFLNAQLPHSQDAKEDGWRV